MKFTLPTVIGLMFVMFVRATPVDYYATRYDHLDVEQILNNRRMVNYYAACLLNKGPCPPQGLEFKRILPEAIMTNCVRCTEKQKVVTYRTIRRLKKEYPKIWVQLSDQWDPNDVFVKKFEQTHKDRANSYPQDLGPRITKPTTTTEAPQVILNRFGDDEDMNDIDSPVAKYPASIPSSNAPVATNSKPSPSKPNTVTSKNTVSSTTNKPYTSFNTFFLTTKSPIDTVGANIQATVSLGTNLVGDVIRGLGSIGTRVVQTGARLADAVINTVQSAIILPR